MYAGQRGCKRQTQPSGEHPRPPGCQAAQARIIARPGGAGMTPETARAVAARRARRPPRRRACADAASDMAGLSRRGARALSGLGARRRAPARHRGGRLRGRRMRAGRLPIVPQGGNTGLVGGGVPYGGIVLSLARLDRIRAVDPVNATMTVEAGCILKPCRTRLRRRIACSRSRSPPRVRAGSAATSPPTPAASRCCATATRAS